MPIPTFVIFFFLWKQNDIRHYKHIASLKYLSVPSRQLVDQTILVLVMKGGTCTVSSPEVVALQSTIPILCFC